MSDDVSCDCCGKTGRRKRFRPCPKGWWFIDTRLLKGDGADLLLFHPGPGPRLDEVVRMQDDKVSQNSTP